MLARGATAQNITLVWLTSLLTKVYQRRLDLTGAYVLITHTYKLTVGNQFRA
ncbi:hypothetical protein CoNPh27_CDS0074 [Staphylococcus phage S-CoN_Ph27]|nr:hypothetical protein CoNPh27_CDS0074 [Staphylococcus phage S-CoN_Ph27]